jgi:programmed cell death 6-interacting protein
VLFLGVSSLGYEKVCVLFNIAALQSQIGAHTRIGESDEDMKGAAKMFQLASGIFAHLKMAPTTMGGQEPTPDLSGDTLSALSALMLAQAQEIFAKKAIADKMKDATVARLCIQCEDMYADALKQLQRDTVKHNWEKDWIPTVSSSQTMMQVCFLIANNFAFF